MEKFERTERVTLLAVFLATIPILVLTFINNRLMGGDIATPYSYWLWNTVIVQAAPTVYWFVEGAPPIVFLLTLCAAFLVFMPMSKTKFAGVTGLMAASYLFAGYLWVYSLGVVWVIWGTAGVIAGLCLAYVGMIPVAFILAILHLELLIPMLVLAACYIITRKIMNKALDEWQAASELYKNKTAA